MKAATAKKPVYRRVWFWILIGLVLILSGMAVSLPFSYGVVNIGIKIACNPWNVIEPDNYNEIVEATEALAKDASYSNSYSEKYGKYDIYAPSGATERYPLVVYIHGGYYVGGDKASATPYCRMIAKEGYIVANINYILAPKGKHPTQLLMVNEAIAYLLSKAEEYHIDENSIFIGGDSAGCHLSGMLGMYYSEPSFAVSVGGTPALKREQCKGLILLCGFYDTMQVRATKFPFVNEAMWMYTGVKKYETFSRVEEMNTLNNVTEQYPPVYLLCGDGDPFYSQNEQMQEKLKEKGVAVTAYLPKTKDKPLNHEFQRDFSLSEAKEAMELLIQFLAERS